VVFCHNDLQEGNILLPDMSGAAKKPSTSSSSSQSKATTSPTSSSSPSSPLSHSQPSASSPSSVLTDDRVVLIDFEYCAYSYRGFDLANHFCEWAFDYSNPDYPHFYADESNYPSDKQKRTFVREYLRQWSKQGKVDPRNSEEHLLREAEYYTLASHLLWTLWSIKNAFTSEITFGYWEYGKTRLDAYLRHRRRQEATNNNLP